MFFPKILLGFYVQAMTARDDFVLLFVLKLYLLVLLCVYILSLLTKPAWLQSFLRYWWYVIEQNDTEKMEATVSK